MNLRGVAFYLSDLNAVAQSISNLITNTDSAVNQMSAYSKQINEMLASVNSIMIGTTQHEYQELINQLLVSKKKIEFATDSLVKVSQSGKEWLREHVTSSDTRRNSSYDMEHSSSMGPEPYEDAFKPTRNTPRDLTVSQYGFTKNANGMEVYDSPLEVDKYLYSKQGSAYENFKGTCGLCSCANVLRLAGVNYGEKEMIDYAANQEGGLFAERLCTVNRFSPSASGGTTPKQRQQILDHFGVSSSVWDIKTDADGRASTETIEDIAKWISEGRGVIVDVDAGLFYNSPRNYGKGHAVTITSIEKNGYGDVTAFYILDSNQGTIKCTSCELQDVLRTFVGINVTSQIIR